jgi:small subunit ribosomal protein S1
MSKGDSESFAEMFAREAMPGSRARALSVGDEIEGVVAHISADAVLVDLDAKQQGWFQRGDLSGPDGELVVQLGDRVRGHVVEIDRATSEIQLGSALGKKASREQLALAHEQGVPVEGKVMAINKGGAEVEVGGMRGFCPLSQLDARYVEDPSVFVGQTLRFAVTELRDRDVVLSRRRLLAHEAEEARARISDQLQEGSVQRGRVTQVRDFGAFVDLGGVEGLIHVSEISWSRVQHPADALACGQEVEVLVLSVDREQNRVALSLKRLLPDPWDTVEQRFQVGQIVEGVITNVVKFGAFVCVGDGLEGLVHVSELGDGDFLHPRGVAREGESVRARIIHIDGAARRLGLSLREIPQPPALHSGMRERSEVVSSV